MADGAFVGPYGEAASLRARLPLVETAEAERRNGWLAALASGGLQAELVETLAAPALRFSASVWVTPESIDGAPASWIDAPSSPVLPEALVAFSRLEPLLERLERAVGFALDPEGIEEAPRGLTLRITFDGHAARVTVAEGVRTPVGRPERLVPTGAAAEATMACRLTLQGPLAPADELAMLAPGDLVVAASSPDGIKGWLSAPGVGTVGGRVRPASARFLCEGTMDTTMPGAPPEEASSAGDLPGSLKVRLRLELAAVDVTLADLAALAPGSVLPVEALADAPVVTVTAPGATLATGRLVALGEGYGVLVDAVNAPAA